MEDATSTVLAWIRMTGWPEHDGEAQPWHINLGRCADWARLVCARVPEAVMDEWDDRDSEMLHTFVIVNGRYFDSECLDGVFRVQDLPSFARPWQDRSARPAGDGAAEAPEITWHRIRQDGETTHEARADGKVVARVRRNPGARHGYYNAFDYRMLFGKNRMSMSDGSLGAAKGRVEAAWRREHEPDAGPDAQVGCATCGEPDDAHGPSGWPSIGHEFVSPGPPARRRAAAMTVPGARPEPKPGKRAPGARAGRSPNWRGTMRGTGAGKPLT